DCDRDARRPRAGRAPAVGELRRSDREPRGPRTRHIARRPAGRLLQVTTPLALHRRPRIARAGSHRPRDDAGDRAANRVSASAAAVEGAGGGARGLRPWCRRRLRQLRGRGGLQFSRACLPRPDPRPDESCPCRDDRLYPLQCVDLRSVDRFTPFGPPSPRLWLRAPGRRGRPARVAREPVSAGVGTPVTEASLSSLQRCSYQGGYVSILWIILIVVLVLALLGFVGR